MKEITDQLSRPIRDLRISVTDRCNFRCTYCMPKEIFGNAYPFLTKEALLTYEELLRIATLFARLGVKKLRITGGEPLLRRDLPLLITQLQQIEGIEDIGLTTNGVLLDTYAEPLFDAGLRRLNVSLDALDPIIFGEMNGRGTSPEQIIHNLSIARQLGFHVKVNMVVQKGVNEQEIVPMATYFKEQGIPLRFIEFMDVGNDNAWSFEKVVSKKAILQRLQSRFELEQVDPNYYGEVAKRYRYRDNGVELGFISSVSDSFCSTCTRARISSDGQLYTCLFASEGYDLRALLRSGKTDAELLEEIAAVWSNRTDRYSDERTAQTAKNRRKMNMSYLGG